MRVALDVVDRLLDRADACARPARGRGTRSPSPPRRRAALGAPSAAAASASARSSTPASASSAPIGPSSGSASRCTSSVSAALQTPGPLRLGVDHDRQRLGRVGVGVQVDVAVAAGGDEHGHAGVLEQELLEPLAAARDDDVAGARGRRRSRPARRASPRAGSTASSGSPAATRPSRTQRSSTAFVRARARRAAQQAGVAALEAQAGHVDGDVRARLVDDEQHAERHAHLLHVEPVRQPPAADDLADGIVERGDRAHRVAQLEHALGVERQAVEQRARLAGARGPRRDPRRWPRRSRPSRARARRAICSSAASLAPRPSVASVRAAARARVLADSVVTAIVEDQIIAMDGLRDAGDGRVLAGRAAQLGAAHGHDARRERARPRACTRARRRPRGSVPSTRFTPTGSRLAPRESSAVRAPASTKTRPAGGLP